MKVVIDSNIFVSCLTRTSPYFQITQNLIFGKFTLCVTTEIVLEYLEVFQQKFISTKATFFYDFIVGSKNVLDTDIYFKWNLITIDPDDNKFIDCYIAANADYLVTNDNHFNILKKVDFPPIKCIAIDDFLELLKKP